MLQVKAYIDKSKIHGLGVFAGEKIKKGDVVWKFEPSIDKIIKDTSILSESVKEYVKTYAYFDKQLGALILSTDVDRYTNHSDTPNTVPIESGTVVANKDIVIGEEITIDYYDIDEYAREKLI